MRQFSRLTLSTLFLLPISVFVNAQTVVLTGDASVGEKKALICSACHGAGGVSTNPTWPKLAGQHEQYIQKQLFDFRQSSKSPDNAMRDDPSMRAQVAALSDQDIADLAAYYNKQATTMGVSDEKLVKRGQEIYRGGDLARNIPACTACHSPTGVGNGPAKYPLVTGQHADYMAKQLHDFKNGIRKNDNARIMRDIAERLSDDEIKAVSSYMQGLHP